MKPRRRLRVEGMRIVGYRLDLSTIPLIDQQDAESQTREKSRHHKRRRDATTTAKDVSEPTHLAAQSTWGLSQSSTQPAGTERRSADLGKVSILAVQGPGIGRAGGCADLHALGVLLYELSTGQHPYRDEAVSKVLHRILEEMPRKAGEVNPQLSPFFEEVVQALVVKDRDQRFPSASDLAGVLEEGENSQWWRGRARALRAETKRPLRRIRIPRETALYGRDDDLDQLHALYEKAKARDGQVLLVEGEAGIGNPPHP